MTLKERITLLGDRILIQLDEKKDHSISEGGIVIPDTELAETDGGRLTTRLTDKNYLTCGTILLMSEDAKTKLPTINEGDRVYVASHAVNPSNHFYIKREQLINQFAGIICIPHLLIEAKINAEL